VRLEALVCLSAGCRIQSRHAMSHYHEALVHPAMIIHSCPETVCVVGGGEEQLCERCWLTKTVKKAVMVDIVNR